MMSAPELTKKREALSRDFSKADAALANGTITQAEHEAFLNSRWGTMNERDALQRLTMDATAPDEEPGHDPRVLVAGFLVLMVSLFGALFWTTGGITGAVVFDTTLGLNETYASDATMTILLNSTESVSFGGILAGLGDATLTLIDPSGVERLIAAYQNSPPATAHGSLAKNAYGPGEPVTLTITGDVLGVTLAEPSGTRVVPTDFSETLAPGSYTLLLTIAENETPEALAFTVASEPVPSETVFATCGDACALDRQSGEATLRITITGDARVTITDVIITNRPNNAPALVTPIPEQEGVGSITLDLAPYYVDADGDALLYDTSQPDGGAAVLAGSRLTILGAPGVYSMLTYASDLRELTPSNTFTVTILDGSVPVDNTTGNETTPPENTTIEPPFTPPILNETLPEQTFNDTGNATQPNATEITACDDPNPNARPEYCLNLEAATYFEEEVLLTNTARSTAGRLTSIGNLLILGGVVENSLGEPGPSDWTLGYSDGDFQTITTIWIDSTTGDLHLRGHLIEESANLLPPAGSAKIVNRRGVYMAWADQYTGDLHIRGNVIPYRRSLG